MILATSVGCTRDEDLVTQSVLKQDAAARIQLPGSILLREVGGERVDTPTGPSPAFFGRIAGTERSPEDVRAFFEREIVALGWRADRPPAIGVTERDGWGWCKQRMRFRLTIVDPVRLARTGVQLGTDLPAIIYDARLIASGRDCPAPEATWPPNAP